VKKKKKVRRVAQEKLAEDPHQRLPALAPVLHRIEEEKDEAQRSGAQEVLAVPPLQLLVRVSR
jgi:hypothetical protein